MTSNFGPTLYKAECAILVALLGGLLLSRLTSRLSRDRPGLRLGPPLLMGAGFRLAAALAINYVPPAQTLPGPDEEGFLRQAEQVAGSHSLWSFLTSYLPGNVFDAAGNLHLQLLTGQLVVLGDPGTLVLRLTQMSLSLAAIALLSAAVYNLAGRTAALATAWIVALEPSGVVFSAILNKEAPMFLAEGLVLYGVSTLSRKPIWHALAALGGGCAIGFATRPYAGAFIGVSLLVTLLVITLRAGPEGRPLVARIAIIAVLIAVSGVAVASHSTLLSRLQSAQDFYSSGPSNLALEPVEFSTPAGVAQGLPGRMKDLLMRPYPWQATNLSQRLGIVGSAMFWVLLAVVAAGLLQARGAVWSRAGPILCMSGFVFIGYALTISNAGTAFRYRVHVTFLLAGAATALVLVEGTPLARRVDRLVTFRRRRADHEHVARRPQEAR